ncbi:hypothetical protein [Nitrobacter sp. JJSN]|uniref:hypothetical protein n=1 Tax=Nitrobacter sp. JJSN TaxID=3453033 RepID=UPI003F76473C
MNLTDLRPLSELYTADVTRLRRLEIDAIIARHRVSFNVHRLATEAERLTPIKELLF